jgi:hypothetical protein
MKFACSVVIVNVLLLFYIPSQLSGDPGLAHTCTTLAYFGIVTGIIGVLCKIASGRRG